MENNYKIEIITQKCKQQIKQIAEREWSSNLVVSMGKTYEVDKLDGFVALNGTKIVGFITYYIENNECEIVALDSEISNIGIGSALITSVISLAKKKKCKKIKLITTNDNINAISFYQKRGFTIANIYVDSIKKARKIKPIPLIGNDGIPIRDEIEFELKL